MSYFEASETIFIFRRVHLLLQREFHALITAYCVHLTFYENIFLYHKKTFHNQITFNYWCFIKNKNKCSFCTFVLKYFSLKGETFYKIKLPVEETVSSDTMQSQSLAVKPRSCTNRRRKIWFSFSLQLSCWLNLRNKCLLHHGVIRT